MYKENEKIFSINLPQIGLVPLNLSKHTALDGTLSQAQVITLSHSGRSPSSELRSKRGNPYGPTSLFQDPSVLGTRIKIEKSLSR